MKQTEKDMSRRSRIVITITLALSMLLASLGTSIANIALPTLAKALSAPFVEVQAVVVSYLAALTISVVIAGRLGDKFGLKRVLIIGLTIFTAGSLLCALAPTLWMLVGARAIQGTGAAFMMTLAMALMRQTASEARVGRAMGLLGTVSALGTALGPALGGLLIPLTGWRGIFWVLVPLASNALLLAIATLNNVSSMQKAKLPGLSQMRIGSLMPNLLINVLVATVMMSTLVVGPFYLGLSLHLNATQVGFVMAIGPMISIVSGVPSGRLVDGWGSGRVLLVGLILLSVGSFLLAILPNLVGVTGYLLSVMVLTPGYQLLQAANNTAALTGIPKDRHGTVSGLLSLSRNIGLIAGASLMGAVFAFGAGTEDFIHASPEAIAVGMRITFLLASALMIVAIGIASTRNTSAEYQQ